MGIIHTVRSYVGAIVVGIGHSIMPRDMREVMHMATDVGLEELHRTVDLMAAEREQNVKASKP